MADGQGFELASRPPAPHLAGLLHRLTGYRETAPAALFQRHAAPLLVPLIVSFGTPFRIALSRPPGAADAQGSFAAGLHAGCVDIDSDGGAACVQADLAPLGAVRLFGGAMPALASRMVPLTDLFGTAARRLRDQLGTLASWPARFDLVEDFIMAQSRHEPSREVAFAWRRLAAGEPRIAAIATELGWSRQRLHQRFRAEAGIGPKVAARMLRFHRACRLARRGGEGWAGIAAAAGYADQAHLAREFTAMAGEPPTAWARRSHPVPEPLTDPAAW